ncbi:MAG: SUMF1/EgtB/PvdO family nonheme iron enzyme [Treponema sp.]|jgi:formylglycine-generating enzyme required for sulfatase activity|nr:SUMF1/EgtB/PvdO family nonheme iron enzyme [Treponema sp.]
MEIKGNGAGWRMLIPAGLVLFTLVPLAAQDRRGIEAIFADAVVGKQWAVFIAIDRYQEWGPLSNPVKDATELRDILTKNYFIDEVRELYDNQATVGNIRRLFEGLTREIGMHDSVFVFYAGHGYTDRVTKTDFWIPVDGGRDTYEQIRWLPNIQVRNMLVALPAKHVFLVSDACFSGDILDTSKGETPIINDAYFRRAYSLVSRQVMTSGANEEVPDASEFAMRLKSALTRAEGLCIDPQSLFTTVREVRQTQPMLGAIAGSEHQNGGSFLFFRRQTPSSSPRRTDLSGAVDVGIITVSSEIAGIVMIDGAATGTRIKEGGTATIRDVSTGKTTVAVKGDDGTIIETAQPVMVAAGQTVHAVVERLMPDGFVRIQGGTFIMGSPASEVDRQSNEVQHQVTVRSFSLGKYEVTQKEYQAVMGTNPSNFKGDNLPVENVSWYDAVQYCNARSQRESLTPVYAINGETVTWNRNARGYRLPTEAEWEYACRAGTTTPFSTGNNITTNQANYSGRGPYNNNAAGIYREKMTAIGSFAANLWGLYDMHGNVWEWCWDWYGSYGSGSQTDPVGASSGTYRVRRGGGWSGNGQYLRSATRGGSTPSVRYGSLGFRLARPSL